MKVILTPEHIATTAGKEILEPAVRTTLDGKLDLPEIKDLRRWLRANQADTSIPAIGYLHDIMARITADNRIDRDELLELHLAVERVIPTTFRAGVKEARRNQEAAIKEKIRERERVRKAEEKARLKEEKDRANADEIERRNRLRHEFAKVAGVSFPNEDGTERQTIIRNCRAGEPLILRHDPNNGYSAFATQVLRQTGQLIGHAPEYLAERICEAVWNGTDVFGAITSVTGGTADKPTRGVNFAVFYVDPKVSHDERDRYIQNVMAEETRKRW